MINLNQMNVVKKRENDIVIGNSYKIVSKYPMEVKILAANNILAASITKRVFNINGIKRLNISPYVLVDNMIDNINMKDIALSVKKSSKNLNNIYNDIQDIIYQLIRNEMIRISLELQSTVDDYEIDKVMNILSPDIDLCASLLSEE